MTLPRATGDEWMDAPDLDRASLAASLADLRAVNRWLGGTRVVLRHLGRMVARNPRRSWRVLDLATGSGDIPRAVAAWARARGVPMEIVATDNHPVTLDLARAHLAGEASVRVAAADARALPYADASFDVALCSTALHHFDAGDDVVRVLAEMDRVARVGGIVNDLHRTRAALLGAHVLAATAWRRHPVTRHDGPLSVRRAFTPRELADFARQAGLRGARAHAHVPFRVALAWEKPEGGG